MINHCTHLKSAYRWDHYYKVQAHHTVLSIPDLYECIWESNFQYNFFLPITNLSQFSWNANITTVEFKQEKENMQVTLVIAQWLQSNDESMMWKEDYKRYTWL